MPHWGSCRRREMWIWVLAALIVGLFLGSNLGVLLMCLMQIARTEPSS